MKKILISLMILFTTISEVNSTPRVEYTKASYYADRFHGRTTSDGSILDNSRFTAAHRRLPFGSRVLVVNLHNNQGVIVTINDRGPFIDGRGIDLTLAAANAIGMIDNGIVRIRLTVLNRN